MELCRDNADRALERETAVLSLSGAKLSEQVRPHLRRDCAHRGHICTGTGLTPCHICAGTGPGKRGMRRSFRPRLL